MKPIELYPSDRSLKKSAGFGGFLLFLAFQVETWSRDGSAIVPLIFAGFGLALIYPIVKNHIKPTPTFEADTDGFSVMGKPKRGWDEYRGVKVNTIYLWFIPISRSLIIKTGKNILGGRIQVNPAYLSGAAKEMAGEIDAYAKHAQRKEQLSAAMSALPAEPIAARADAEVGLRGAAPKSATPTGVTFAPPQSDVASSGSPVQSVPKLSDRLFGRRNVL